jgi:hypothetical protein
LNCMMENIYWQKTVMTRKAWSKMCHHVRKFIKEKLKSAQVQKNAVEKRWAQVYAFF